MFLTTQTKKYPREHVLPRQIKYMSYQESYSIAN